MINPPGNHSAHRLFEWVAASSMFNTGFVLMTWPHTLAAGNLRPLLHVLSEIELTSLYLIAGLIRMITLFLNGSLGHFGPITRLVTAAISLIIWLQMIAALWLQLGQPSMTTGIFASLAIGELVSVVRARRDLHGE